MVEREQKSFVEVIDLSPFRDAFEGTPIRFNSLTIKILSNLMLNFFLKYLSKFLAIESYLTLASPVVNVNAGNKIRSTNRERKK